MARLPTTSDVFNAVAEPLRRRILDLLAQGEMSVNEIADALDLKQPQTSKHLKVLKEVGVVSVRGSGKQRMYRLESAALQPIHTWTQSFQQYWAESFARLDDLLAELQEKENGDDSDSNR